VPEPYTVAVEDAAPISERRGRTVRVLCEHPLLDATWSRYEGGQPGPDPHVHHEHVDAFYIMEGELQFLVGSDVQPVRAPAGTFVLVPPNVVHGFDNVSDSTARWLNFHAPSTGFIPYLKGERERFDSFDPPSDGGRPASDATVVAADERALGHEPQLLVTQVEIEEGAEHELRAEGVAAAFVLGGHVEPGGGGPGTWLRGPATLRGGSGGARLLVLVAPAP
jgi:quercetin dioxygenase-like cupin family protein